MNDDGSLENSSSIGVIVGANMSETKLDSPVFNG